MLSLSLQKEWDLKRFLFTASLTDVTFPRPPARTMLPKRLQNSMKSASARLPLLWDATTQWTETTAGKGFQRLMPQWFTARASRLVTPLKQSESHTKQLTETESTSRTNLFFRPSALKTQRSRPTTLLFSSTSVRTEQGKSQEPLLTRNSPVLKGRTAFSRFTMSA